MNKKKRKIESYAHEGKERANNPPVGLVTPNTDPDAGRKKTYAYDPHLDPQLHWAGKAEHTSFDVPTVSLHVHERIDPRTIVEAVRKHNGSGGEAQLSLFAQEREIPLRQEIEFYRHSHNWSNRLVAGDSLLVMNSLLQKENMAGKVQCVYMDPPYGIKYGSNFQPFVNNRDVKDGKDEDLTAEPEMIKAFRDTWELGIHSYLSYMRDRLLLARELLTDSGSVFVQISDENVHHVREIMDEVFGVENFVSIISFRTHSPLGVKHLPNSYDYIVWYGKNLSNLKFRTIYVPKNYGEDTPFNLIETLDGKRFRLRKGDDISGKLKKDSKVFRLSTMSSSGYTPSCTFAFEYEGRNYNLAQGKSWRTTKSGMQELAKQKRLYPTGNYLNFVQYHDDFSIMPINNNWDDVYTELSKQYVVQTSIKVIQRCLLMTTDPGDLVFDPTCGSGTTAFVAEQWGRRWITCDTSRVATSLAKQRLMTATFDYYKLAYPDEGVGSGFEYKKVPHITLKSIANNEPAATETLYDQPLKDTKRARVTGPFTVEAVPSPTVQPLIEPTLSPALSQREREQEFPSPSGRGIKGEGKQQNADDSIARTGETLRQHEWRDELLKTGIRGKGGQRISFSRIEPLPCRWLHADAETRPDDSGVDEIKEAAATAHQPRRAVISFGPEHAPMEQRQIELALQEAATLVPKPTIVIFAAFQFDPEAAKDIDETNWPGVNLLKVQMNADMQNEDLKRKRASNESFWLVGQPDVGLRQIRKGDYTGKWQVEVRGFDYFNTKTGELESGNKNRIAVWMLDTDYDGRSLYPSQVFFPMAGEKDGWAKLAKNLKAEIDSDMIEAYRGTISLPFKMGDKERVAVKIVDDRGIESLRILPLFK